MGERSNMNALNVTVLIDNTEIANKLAKAEAKYYRIDWVRNKHFLLQDLIIRFKVAKIARKLEVLYETKA